MGGIGYMGYNIIDEALSAFFGVSMQGDDDA